MISNALDRISFWSLFLVITLLPIFFLPFSKIPVETSKGLLLVIGLAISIIFWTAARFSDGKISLPKSKLLLAGLGIAVSFLLSAFFSSGSQQVSVFGTMFDIGTFWFTFSAFLLMLISSVVLNTRGKARVVLLGVVTSFAVVFVFQVLHSFMPNTLSFGVMSGKIANLFGTWNALGLFAGLVGVISLFSIEFFSGSKSYKRFLVVLIIFSLVLLAIVNFTLAWKLFGIFALIIFVYKISFFAAGGQEERKSKNFPMASMIVVMISLLFFMAGQSIGGLLPSRLGVSNVEISPSFQATMQVTKSSLKANPIFGVGPNKFSDAWAKYKPDTINLTQFWDTSFDFGSGTLLTFVATTGILGILAWLLFLYFLVSLGMRSFSSSIKNNTNTEMTIFFIASLYLFVSSIFYSTGVVMFLLAFAFTGIFMGLSVANKDSKEIQISFLGNPRKGFFSILFLVVVMMVTAAFSFKYVERFVSVYYFGKTLAAQDIPSAESSINKTVSLYQNDLYLRTYSQVYLLKLNDLASKGASLTDAEKADLQASLNKAITSAQLATTVNNANYLNFRMLGSVYESVGAYKVEGAYDKAIEAYNQASLLNPTNPGLKLSEARVSFANGKTKEAKDFANQALSLKKNYIEALIILSQIVKSEGDHAGALSYAEQALSLSPTNKDLIQYVNSLKGVSTTN